MAAQQLTPDREARQQAQDTRHSLSLSAPAGSGKTELLTQRILRLLAQVDRPEAILAITFTRKATGEMRDRILKALLSARTDQTSADIEEHQRATLELARAALAQNDRQQWALLENPNRLQILTFDGLCRRLANSLPLESGVSLPPEIADSPKLLYRDAALETLRHLDSSHPIGAELHYLLGQLSVDLGQAVELIADLLPSRQSWLALITGENLSRQWLQETLEQLVREQLVDIRSELAPFIPELATLIEYAQTQGGTHLEAGLEANVLESKTTTSADLEGWQALASFLLTKDGKVRSAVDKRLGFPEKNAQKVRMQTLLADLGTQSSLIRSLDALRTLPRPNISAEEWRLIQALASVLRIAAAELRLLQQARGVCDHAEVGMAALRALGEPEQPTPLAERLDYRIQHILVDEFQDTSGTQIQLLERLTAGWTQDDGRTLFVVGDAMQSIYEFRQARVELFMRVSREGIGDVQPLPLALTANFRSRPLLVDEVSRIFQHSLGPVQVQEQGFSPADAVRSPEPQAALHCIGCLEDSDEAQAVATHIRNLLNRGEKDIALLVRGRRHLEHLLPVLRDYGISWQAQDIDPLASRMAIQDIDSITRALCSPADRIAWLALLRAPWAGLNQADLLALSQSADEREICLAEAVREASLPPGLSAAGEAIVRRLSQVLGSAQQLLGQVPLAALVEQCWCELDGMEGLFSATDYSNVQDYLSLLEAHSERGALQNWEAFDLALASLYARPQGSAEARVQIMTIHKAKGLEFDHVIVPALAKVMGGGTRQPLLAWSEVELRDGQRRFLMSPKAKYKRDNALYDYLQGEAKERRRQEQMRLLYVAMTRARESLLLSAVLNEKDSGEILPPANLSLLAGVWDCLEQEFTANLQRPDELPATEPRILTGIRRLLPDRAQPRISPLPDFLAEPQTTEFTARLLSRAIGDLMHADLCLLAGRLENQNLLEDCRASWARRLSSYGLTESGISEASAILLRAQQQIVQSKTAQWLLANHSAHHAELPMAALDPGGNLRRQVLDRTFVDASVRWIIDYKMAQPGDDEDLESFLVAQRQRYRQQLESYAALYDDFPLRKALYFPLLDHLEELT